MQKDFTIERALLTKHMKYFQKCLKDIPLNEEIDISVHCDAQIFEWLIKYIEILEKQTPDITQVSTPSVQQLDQTNVISIMISADFLRIEPLTGQCL